MGLGNNNHSTFLSVSNGKICKQVINPTEQSTARTNKNGKEVHEEFYDHITGTITDIFVKDHPEYGKFWVVKIDDGDNEYQLQMNYSSGYSSAFLKTLPNVDLTKEVTLIPKLTIEGEKKKTGMFISQNGHALKHYYTKDHPNGLPQLEQKKVKGKMTWDDSLMMEFLEDMVMKNIRPKLSVVAQGVAAEDATNTDLL